MSRQRLLGHYMMEAGDHPSSPFQPCLGSFVRLDATSERHQRNYTDCGCEEGPLAFPHAVLDLSASEWLFFFGDSYLLTPFMISVTELN